jgi:hypothetical protein
MEISREKEAAGSEIPELWKAADISEIQSHLGSFRDWVLCGGHSLDFLLGRKTRTHEDIDIGVFRSQLLECLHGIGAERVFLCQPPGKQTKWNGLAVPDAVHDIWICDRQQRHWCLQVMVFDDEGDEVFYRRDRRIHWSKASHSIAVAQVRILNPLITFLYRANKPLLLEKEVEDIVALIAAGSEQPAPWTLK